MQGAAIKRFVEMDASRKQQKEDKFREWEAKKLQEKEVCIRLPNPTYPNSVYMRTRRRSRKQLPLLRRDRRQPTSGRG